MIRLAARVLGRLASSSPDERLGHVGGDDFVAVFLEGVGKDALERVRAPFVPARAAGNLTFPEERGSLSSCPT
jgi:hypothetical protein